MGEIKHLHEHPEYRCYMTPPEVSSNEEQEIAASLNLLEKESPPLGANVCFLCEHRRDRRVWWKRILFRPQATSFVCDLFERTSVQNPVTGKTEYLEKVNGLFDTKWILTQERFRSCLELNPDGNCVFFQINLGEKKNSGDHL